MEKQLFRLSEYLIFIGWRYVTDEINRYPDMKWTVDELYNKRLEYESLVRRFVNGEALKHMKQADAAGYYDKYSR